MVSQIIVFVLNGIPMEDTLNIYSFNCRGLGNNIKRASIFEWLKHLKGDIYFLQRNTFLIRHRR